MLSKTAHVMDESVAVNTELLHQLLSPSFYCLSESQRLLAVIPGQEFTERRGQQLSSLSFL